MRYGLRLAGWEDASSWGWDEQAGTWFAELTRNGNDDDDGPDVWLSGMPRPIPDEAALAAAIGRATGAALDDVAAAMAAGRR